MIIGFAGKKRSGKDSAAQYLMSKYPFKRYAFGDPVKEICRILFGWNEDQLFGEKKEEITSLGISPRESFQKIGTDFGRDGINQLFPNLKIEAGSLWIEIFKRSSQNKNLVISDVRFQNEANAIKELGGHVIYIDSKYSIDDCHLSEMINISYDYKLENYGTIDEFYQNIESILSLIENDSLLPVRLH